MRGSAEALMLVVLAGGGAADAGAQVRASERGSVSQTIDGAVIGLNYSRPRVRGRMPLFGKVIHWGEVWTPGANWATTLEVSRDIKLDGHAVPKGKYSMWFVVRPDRWTLVLDPRVQIYHSDPPDSSASQLRWTVKPTVAPATEALTWTFPEIRPDGGTLVMNWGTTRVSLAIAVPPKHPLTIARGEIEPYLGRYEIAMSFGGPDSLFKNGETVELYYESESLKVRFQPTPEWYPSLQNGILVKINDDWFIPTVVKNGKLLEMVADLIFEFTLENGKAVSFEVRDDHDEFMGRGRRVAPPR